MVLITIRILTAVTTIVMVVIPLPIVVITAKEIGTVAIIVTVLLSKLKGALVEKEWAA
ncbi:hypothetical protein QNH48_01500 [Neobacillus sp. YX16]|uniref:hypothetical protein n=1 Tax=Neobacillus sp. YX16 TaxID=3047874 RepID=UPI0024C2E064|nr:hypothetical protein [Neobacillus sp. YX16]WHZ03401.1 hypothetical protein QNH48_01500 [Neobacillus sp. YX16]